MTNQVVNKSQEKSFSLVWKFLAGVNLFLGSILWFGYLFDYSWAGTLSDILFLPTVGLTAFISVGIVMWTSGDRFSKIITGLACLPSLVGGCLPVLLAVVLLLTPLGLGVIFIIADIISEETLIQQIISPDGSEVAEEYLKGTGAYTGEHGQIIVRIKNRLFPLIEHEVYYVSNSEVNENSVNYLLWKDNKTLYIPETQEEVKIGILGVNIQKVHF